MELIQQSIEKGLIRFDEDRKNIFYLNQDKRRPKSKYKLSPF